MVLTDEIKQKVAEKWETAYELAYRLTSAAAVDSDHPEMTYHHTKQQVDVYELKSDSTTTVVRGDVIVEGLENLQEYKEYFCSADMNLLVKVDGNTKRLEVLEEWKGDDGSVWRIQYFCVSAGAPFVSDRDFLYVIRFFKKDNCEYFVSTSIDGLYEPPSEFKPQKGAVRGTTVFSTQRYEHVGDNSYLVTYVNHAVPNGWIPTSVVNAAIYPVPLTLVKVADMVGKKVRTPPNSPSLKKK